MFWSKLLGKKAWTIAAIWVENTEIYSVLERSFWQESLNHCFNMGKKHCNLKYLGTNFFGKKFWTIEATWVENTVNYGVLEQVVCKKSWTIEAIWVENTVNYGVLEQVVWQEIFNHWNNMGGKHCKLRCFGASCLARNLQPLKQHGWKTL